MIFLVLYDQRGQCQRVAQTNNANVAQQFLNAGFIEVPEAEYQRCAELVDGATLADLPRLQQARQFLQNVGGTPTTQLRVQTNVDALERLRRQQANRLSQITVDYLAAEMSQARWFRLMTDTVTQGNIAATGIAIGGLVNLSLSHQQEIERDNEIQLGYLSKFRRELDELSPKVAIQRSSLYAGATTVRYWRAHSKALGMPPLPAIPGVSTSCMSNCKCNWNFIQLPGEGNWDCQWRVSAVEHCDECLRRQRVFNPLEIRNGVVQPFNPNGINK